MVIDMITGGAFTVRVISRSALSPLSRSITCDPVKVRPMLVVTATEKVYVPGGSVPDTIPVSSGTSKTCVSIFSPMMVRVIPVTYTGAVRAEEASLETIRPVERSTE